MLVIVGIMIWIFLAVLIALATDSTFLEAFWGLLFALVLYSGAVLALTYPFVRLLGPGEESRDALFTAFFFGIPGLLAVLLVLALVRRLLSR